MPGRTLQWFTAFRAWTSVAALATTNLSLYSSATLLSAPVKGVTVTRTILDLRMRNDSVAQDTELAWGITTVNGDAVSAAAFPDPDDQSDRVSWLIRGRLMGNADSLSDTSQWQRDQYDLRAQRVLRDERQELHLILHNSSGGAAARSYAVFARVLMRMP